MSDESDRQEPHRLRSARPGDRVLRMRRRRSRLAQIESGVSTPFANAYHMAMEILTQTPVLWLMGALAVLVVLGPIPVWLFERQAENADMQSYWEGLWWAVSAFSTIGHSGVTLETAGGQIVGSIYSVVSVALFFGAGIAAFSSYFILTWRKPKRQVVDTVNYYLQRLDELTVEELRELDDLTRGLLSAAIERAEEEEREGTEPQEPGPAR